MKSVLFHVPSVDFAILAGAGSAIGLVALIACLLPSYRAAQISPMEALAQK